MKKIVNFDDLNPVFVLCPLQRVQFNELSFWFFFFFIWIVYDLYLTKLPALSRTCTFNFRVFSLI